jgi:3-dehydroquinate synthase
MNDEVLFSAGEFSTRIRFFQDPDEVLGGVHLALFDTNTRPLLASWHGPELIWQAGESSKSWPGIDAALEKAVELGLGRDAFIAGVGGGVVTDMAAFAASLYMRGCQLVLVPTTLLAMVDAAIGGKTGIDYKGLKNVVGTFYPAAELRIWPGFLQKLPLRDFRSGLAEVIKHALLGDGILHGLLVNQREAILAREPTLLQQVIYRAIMVKVGVVERDFRENGERAFLNLGHTFGHALEAVAGFDGSWTHGEAVCWGISRALDLGVRLGLTPLGYQHEVEALLLSYGFVLRAPNQDPGALLAALKHDKKKKAGQVRFVLQTGFGQCLQATADDKQVLATLAGGI